MPFAQLHGSSLLIWRERGTLWKSVQMLVLVLTRLSVGNQRSRHRFDVELVRSHHGGGD